MMQKTLKPTRQYTDYILGIDDITKTFDGVTALNEVSFRIRKGSIKALIGPNGAGKTTLLNVISGLLRPTSGYVEFKDQDITKLKIEKISLLGIARTFQLLRLFTVNDATVLDNVMMGAYRRLKPGIYKALFARFQMIKLEKTLLETALELLDFVGLEGMATFSPSALSFGNQRMLELARSLMTEPEVLLLDEPASGLNEAEVEGLIELLSSLRERGITILLVEHNMKMVMDIADDIVVLNFGQKIAEGNPAEITSKPEVINAYLGEEHFEGRIKDYA